MATLTETGGSRAFTDFCKSNGISDAAAAKALDTTDISVYQWRTGRARPKPNFRSAIALWTHGEVSEAAWLTDEELEDTAKVVPFEAVAATDGAR